MAEGHHHHHPNYMAIFWWLLGLTIAEVCVAFFPRWMPSVGNVKAITIVLLIGMAFAKATLVALYFMHLRFERRTFVIIVTAPVLLAVFLIVMLMPDVGFK